MQYTDDSDLKIDSSNSKKMIDYTNAQWKEKRRTILARDNYTCQDCHTFSPLYGEVILNVDNNIEMHKYYPYETLYEFSSSETGLTIEMYFAGNLIVMPTLQVHHKHYILGNEIWDYNDDDLVTLCKKCHHRRHEKEPIKYYSKGGDIIREEIIGVYDEDNDCLDSIFEPWTLIQKQGNVYSVCKEVRATAKGLVFNREFNSQDEVKNAIATMASDFLKNYLHLYPQS